MKDRLLRSVLTMALVGLSVPTLFGQAGLGSISGTVTDPSHASVPNAKIKIVQTSTNTIRELTSNNVGLFTAPSLQPSKYSVTITAAGFKDRVFTDLELNSFQTMSLGEIVLEIGSGPATEVSVVAEAVQLATESAVRDNTIQSKQVADMPLQGRAYISLLKLIPGASAAGTAGITGREGGPNGLNDFQVNGKGTNTSQLNLDGGGNVDHGTDGKATVGASVESIAEISVLANNFQAQYGSRQGVVINVTTKSGSNQWHGTIWEYLRHEKLNANTASNNLQGLPRAKYRNNYTGGNLSGPIFRNKLFFFINHETVRNDNPTNSTLSRVPTELERQGNFSATVLANGQRPTIFSPGTTTPVPNNILPASAISPLGVALAKVYPLPNFTGNLASNYVNSGPSFTHRWTQTAKIDWNIDDKTRFFARGTYDYERSFATGAFDFTPGNGSWRRPDRAISINLTRTMTPNLIMENLFAWNMDFVHHGLFNYDLRKVDRTALGLGNLPLVYKNVPEQYLGTNPPVRFLPQVSNTGFTDWNFQRYPWFAKAPEWQASSTWTWIHGTHLVKFGAQVVINKKNEYDNSTAKGAFDFAVNNQNPFDTGYNQANVLTGAINSFQQVDNPAYKYSIYNDTDFFVQDTWKVTSKFTLDYGVRFYHKPGERNTRSEETKPAAFNPSLYNAAKAPRFYVYDPANPTRVIDPAFPNSPVPANLSAALAYSIVPNTGDLLNGVVNVGDESPLGNPRFLLWAPRGGFAYQLNNKTVIRGGFGWSYGRPSIGQAVNTFENGLANQVDYRLTSFATLATATNRISPRNFGGMDQSTMRPQTIYDYSLTIQRELPMKILLDIGYVGNLQRHQLITFNQNAVLPGTSYQTKYIAPNVNGFNFNGNLTAATASQALPGSRAVDANLMRPYLGIGSITTQAQVGNNHYDSLQISATKRMSHGFSAQGTYTLSKLFRQTDNAGPFFYNWKDYTGFRANGDRTHNATINWTYDVPAISNMMGKNAVAHQVFDGWALAHVFGIVGATLSNPTFTVQNAGNTNNIAAANLNSVMTGSPDIAARILPLSNPNTAGGTYNKFDATAFAIPAPGGVGQGSMNYLWLPGTFSNDITITKQFFIGEKKSLEFRTSIFNLTNTARYQTLNVTANYKANGATFANGFTLFNSPQRLADNSKATGGDALTQYNAFRTGFGGTNLGTVLDPRRVELALRFKF